MRKKNEPSYQKGNLSRTRILIMGFIERLAVVLVEYTEENDTEAKRQLLLAVYASMSTKYNMSIEEFNNYSSMVYEAMSEPKPQWNYPASLDFVLQAITTIGKLTQFHI